MKQGRGSGSRLVRTILKVKKGLTKMSCPLLSQSLNLLWIYSDQGKKNYTVNVITTYLVLFIVCLRWITDTYRSQIDVLHPCVFPSGSFHGAAQLSLQRPLGEVGATESPWLMDCLTKSHWKQMSSPSWLLLSISRKCSFGKGARRVILQQSMATHVHTMQPRPCPILLRLLTWASPTQSKTTTNPVPIISGIALETL